MLPSSHSMLSLLVRWHAFLRRAVTCPVLDASWINPSSIRTGKLSSMAKSSLRPNVFSSQTSQRWSSSALLMASPASGSYSCSLYAAYDYLRSHETTDPPKRQVPLHIQVWASHGGYQEWQAVLKRRA